MEWIKDPTWDGFLTWVVGAPLRIVLIILGGIVLRWLVHRAIEALVARASDKVEEHDREQPGHLERMIDAATRTHRQQRQQRARTLGTLLRSIATFVIAAVVVLTVMAEAGLPLAPVLTSAGIGGIAIGFGAQALVKDFLSGVFMILEDQYGVGDYIDTGEASGTVEEVTLRVTRLRDASGTVWFVRNGEILRIGNSSRGWSVASIDLQVAASEDPQKVIPLLEQLCTEIYEDEVQGAKLLERPTVAGVESVTGTTMTLRIFARCRPGDQWSLPRALRARAQETFAAHGVRLPPFAPYRDEGRA